MSLTTAVVRELMAAGLSDEALLQACARIERDAPRAVDEQAERRREKDRNRKAAARLPISAESAEIADKPPALKDVQPNLVTVQVSQNPPPYSPPARKNGAQDVLAAFEGTIPASLAAAVVEHRAKLRKPLTPHAAGLLAKQFAKAPSPSEAAETMIARGWQGYEPSWAAGPQRSGHGPPGRKESNNDRLLRALDEVIPDGPVQPQSFLRLA